MPELPPPLPPETRTVGQVIAETIRAYGEKFWPALALGLPLAIADQARIRSHQDPRGQFHAILVQAIVLWLCTPLFALAFVRACSLLYGKRPTRAVFFLAVLIWLPFPFLNIVYILPGLAWLAFIGMAVPAAMVEDLGFRDALPRGRELGRADFVHALGSLAALVVVIGIADVTLTELLHSQSNTGQRAAVFVADLVLSPLLFLGGALLYRDQAARVGSRRARLESNPKER
jgi:hypothetical protein